MLEHHDEQDATRDDQRTPEGEVAQVVVREQRLNECVAELDSAFSGLALRAGQHISEFPLPLHKPDLSTENGVPYLPNEAKGHV
jgi:hypothetical protein